MRGPDRLLHGGARAVGASRAAKMENGARGPHGWQPVAANGSEAPDEQVRASVRARASARTRQMACMRTPAHGDMYCPILSRLDISRDRCYRTNLIILYVYVVPSTDVQCT